MMDDEKKVKRVGMEMSILMSVSLSLCLSLTGTLSSGQFTIPGFLASFLISVAISFMLGLFISVPKINAMLGAKFKLKRGALKTRIIESLVSDLLYSPIMSFLMVTLAWFSARAHGAAPPYLIMLVKGLILSILVGFLLIFLFMPLFLKIVLKRNGFPLDMPRPEDADKEEYF